MIPANTTTKPVNVFKWFYPPKEPGQAPHERKPKERVFDYYGVLWGFGVCRCDGDSSFYALVQKTDGTFAEVPHDLLELVLPPSKI